VELLYSKEIGLNKFYGRRSGLNGFGGFVEASVLLLESVFLRSVEF